MSNRNVYGRAPLGYHGSIPLYSERDDYTDNYDQIAGDHLHSLQTSGVNPFMDERLWRETEESTVELVRKYTSAGDSILDVGVGLGRVLSGFPDLRRYGVDISLGYLEQAQSHGIEVAYALVADLPYANDTFDVVMCTDVLEHVFDLYGTCAKILSVLKPGGVLIVRVPYREDLTSYLDSPYRFVHVRNFDEPSLRLLFGTIFGQELIEVTRAGYVAAASRRIRPIWPNIVLFRLLGLVRRISHVTFRRWLAKWYMPLEINVVVRKRP